MEPIAADEMVIEYVGQNIRQVSWISHVSPHGLCHDSVSVEHLYFMKCGRLLVSVLSSIALHTSLDLFVFSIMLVNLQTTKKFLEALNLHNCILFGCGSGFFCAWLCSLLPALYSLEIISESSICKAKSL